MALPASIPLPSLSLKSRIILPKDRSLWLNGFLLPRIRRPAVDTLSVKVRMAQFMDPEAAPIEIGKLREKIQESIPEPVKKFPWKKAEKMLLERLLFTGKKALKWSLLMLFVYSSLSDFLVSIFRNQELMIPIGLFVGVLLTDLLKEISQEVFRSSEESSTKQQLIGIGCFLVLVKLVSYGFAVKAQAFLLHVANGGLMQVLWLWLWRNLSTGKLQVNEQSPSLVEGTS